MGLGIEQAALVVATEAVNDFAEWLKKLDFGLVVGGGAPVEGIDSAVSVYLGKGRVIRGVQPQNPGGTDGKSD